MKQNGISSIPELSRLANIPATTLYDLVDKKTLYPTTATIEKLVKFFNVSVKDIVNDCYGNYIEQTTFHSISELLQYLMQDLHLTERELSRRTGILQQTISKILTGKTKKPNEATLQSLANFFGITLEEIQLIKPLNSYHEKGTFNNNYLISTKIPYISWDQLYLLPDALKAPKFLYYQYHQYTDDNLFCVNIPDDFDDTDTAPSITKNNKIIINQVNYQHKDLIICIKINKVIMGNIVLKSNKIKLIPININSQSINLIHGEFKYIGKIEKVIKK